MKRRRSLGAVQRRWTPRAPVAEEARNAPGKRMVWDVVETWLKSEGGRVAARQANGPKLTGGLPNPGYVLA